MNTTTTDDPLSTQDADYAPVYYRPAIWDRITGEVIRIYGRRFLEPAPASRPQPSDLAHVPGCPCGPCCSARPPRMQE